MINFEITNFFTEPITCTVFVQPVLLNTYTVVSSYFCHLYQMLSNSKTALFDGAAYNYKPHEE